MTRIGSGPRIVIAALRGGSGKTVLSAGLCHLWRERGRAIVPFKKGPDFIDAGWLALSAGHPCFNLDPFLMSPERILASFCGRSTGADGSVIEGNRGLYDGLDPEGRCSTAELAKLLRAPVILVLDATKTTRTAAAMVLGCQRFDPELPLQGIILNQVAGERHESTLRGAIERYCEVPVLGSVPRRKALSFYERHMGLVPPQEHGSAVEAIAEAALTIEKHVDVEGLWRTAQEAPPLKGPPLKGFETPPEIPLFRPRIGVIRDSAFQFYYPENLEEIEHWGGRIMEIRALDFPELPEVEALYIGGGFPETHAEVLARNEGFRRSIHKRASEGLPIYAECGGLMYLGERLIVDGVSYPMAGVLPVTFGLEKRPQGHGYTSLEVIGENPFLEQGLEFRGHEFHYSRVLAWDRDRARLVFRMKKGRGFDEGRDGLCSGNVLATYTHIHALGTPEWARSLIHRAMAYGQERNGRRESGP